MFASYPTARLQDPDRTLREYMRLTAAIPPHLLADAIDSLAADGREFVPSAGLILHRAADRSVALPPHNGRCDMESWRQMKVEQLQERWLAQVRPGGAELVELDPGPRGARMSSLASELGFVVRDMQAGRG